MDVVAWGLRSDLHPPKASQGVVESELLKRAVAGMRADRDSITRGMLTDVLSRIPAYQSGSLELRREFLRGIRLAYEVVLACLGTCRLPNDREVHRLSALASLRGQQGLELEEFLGAVDLCHQRGIRELAQRIPSGTEGVGVLGEGSGWLVLIFARIKDAFRAGHASALVRAPRRRPSAPDDGDRAILVAALEEWTPRIVNEMAGHILHLAILAEFSSRPSFRHEVKGALADCCSMFIRVFAEERRMTGDERQRVAAFAANGVHADVPVDVLVSAIRIGGVEGLQLALTDFVTEEPWLLDVPAKLISPLALHALHFIEDLVGAIRERRCSKGGLQELRPGVWFDVSSRNLIGREGLAIALRARESRVLAALLAQPGFRSKRQLAEELGRNSPYPAQDHSVEQAVSLLRAKLALGGCGSDLIVCRRGVGYAVARQAKPDPTG